MKKRYFGWLPALLSVILLLLTACTAVSLDGILEEPPSILQLPSEGHTEKSDSETVQPSDPSPILCPLTLENSDSDKGTVEGSGNYLSGSSVTVHAAPRLLGYEFEGWYFGAERLSTLPTYTFTMPRESLVLSARWKVRADLAPFTFLSTEQTCIITGVTDRTVTELLIPDDVTGLASGAFRDCTALTAIALPEGITDLPEDLFRGCSALTDLIYSHEFTSIGKNAFTGCDSLRCSTYGNTRYLAGETPFSWLIGLTDPSVTSAAIHPNAKRMADGAFMNSASLTSVEFSENGSLTEISPYAFYGCTALENVELPEGISSIAEHAFAECPDLSAITLPTSLSVIKDLAFEHCNALSSIFYEGTMAEWELLTVGGTNRLFELNPIHCADGDSIYPIRWHGRAQLTGDDAYLYDLFESAIMAEEPIDTILIKDDRTVTADQCTQIFDVFLHDYPECFWAGNTLSFSVNADTDAVLSIRINYTFTGDELTEAKNALANVVSEILASMPEGSPFEQTLYLHDEVARRVTYLANEYDQTSYGALVRGEAVCAGYAGAYQLLLQSAGYKAWSVSGYAGEPHRWNVVWLDHNTCVYTDVTWDDSEDHPISHAYFGLSLSEMGEDHFPFDPSPLPVCDHDSHSYEDLSDAPKISDSDGIDPILPVLEETGTNRYTAVFYFTGTDLTGWLEDHLEDFEEHFGWHSINVSWEPSRTEVMLFLSGS